jgi:hypothetical protein
MYEKINKLADKLEEVFLKMKAPEVWQLQEVDSESLQLLGLAMARRQNEKQNPKQTRKSRKSRDSGCESDTSSSEN